MPVGKDRKNQKKIRRGKGPRKKIWRLNSRGKRVRAKGHGYIEPPPPNPDKKVSRSNISRPSFYDWD